MDKEAKRELRRKLRNILTTVLLFPIRQMYPGGIIADVKFENSKLHVTPKKKGMILLINCDFITTSTHINN